MLERIHLAVVQEVEKQGSLTAAADVLCVTQSALSHSMKKLEQQLGTDIWLREGRSLRLTQAGQYLLAVANRVLPPEPFSGMAWSLPEGVAEPIPASITLAAAALEADKILPEVLGEELVSYWLGTRRWEWIAFHTMGGGDPDAGLTGWEFARYFELV